MNSQVIKLVNKIVLIKDANTSMEQYYYNCMNMADLSIETLGDTTVVVDYSTNKVYYTSICYINALQGFESLFFAHNNRLELEPYNEEDSLEIINDIDKEYC